MAPLGGLNSKTGSSDFRLGLGAFVVGKGGKKNDMTEGGALCLVSNAEAARKADTGCRGTGALSM